MRTHNIIRRVLAATLATLLFWTPLAPSVARAQEYDLSAEDQERIAEAAQGDRVPIDERAIDTSVLEGERQEAPPPDSASGSTLALPGGDTRTAVSPQAISLPTAEGSVEGMGESFTPNLSSGTGSFSVPIAVAPGRAGVQPSFGLAYSTSGGNGVAGFGWSMSAPFISRQVDRGVPNYDDLPSWHVGEDRFIYNGGQELVPVDSAVMARIDLGSSSGVTQRPDDVPASWQEYRARIEGGFMRFFRSADRERWVVLSKDGSRFDFGRVPSGEGSPHMVSESVNALERDPDDTTRIYRWMLTRMVDVHGSPVWYRYTQNQGQAYLRDVTYVSPLGACPGGTPYANRRCPADLDSYASRVTFQYDTARGDVYDTWVSGWRIATAWRLSRVLVTAWDDDLGERALVRRYHLTYQPGTFQSLLQSVQLEGREEVMSAWGVPVLGAARAETLVPDGIFGPTLPAMRFTYSALPAGFSNVAQTALGSPPHSVDESRSELFDVNSDGLPDLVVTDPARYRTSDGRPAAGVFFNGFTGSSAQPAGRTAAFSGAIPMEIPAGLDSAMAFSNPNIAPMDIDGDGRSDLLHMPRVRTYGWFTPTRAATAAGEAAYSPAQQGWEWTYAEIDLPTTDADPRIDLGRDSTHIQVLDVNNDHLIDVVRTTGTEIQTWLNLGWLEGGDGRFGSYSWSGSTPALSTQPVRTCLPVAGTVFDFDDPEARLGDMNGDGLQDLVRIRRGRVIYWPGRGDGSFGIGTQGCAPGLTSDRHIEMATAPPELNTELSNVHLADVDNDGASDVVQVRFDAVDIWLNRAGRSFAPRTIVTGMPATPAYASRVRLVDIDGSGTLDVVYGNAHGWRYVDLAGGQRPRLLVGVENGLGAQTTLEYETSADDYVRDLAACAEPGASSCFTWSQPGDGHSIALQRLANGARVRRSGGSPVVSTVVRAVSTSDRMNVLGLEAQVSRQEFEYHEGYYEGIEQEFRGFGVTDAWAMGDWNNPTTITRTWFHQGRRSQDIADSRREHNPDESLKGREYLTETMDGEGNYLASAHATLAVRFLAEGLDGRPIEYAYVSEANELRYDTTPFEPSALTVDLADVVRQSVNPTNGAWTTLSTGGRSRTVSVRGAREARIRTTYDDVDNLGQVLQQTAHGHVATGTGAAIDVPIVGQTRPQLFAPWTWRTRASWTGPPESVGGGPPASALGYSAVTTPDPTTGDPLTTTQLVTGVPSLDFSGGPIALAATNESMIASVRYDAWGQAAMQCAGATLVGAPSNLSLPLDGCLRFGTVTRDALFGQLAITETAWTGSGAADTLVTRGTWNRSMGLLLSATAPNGESSAMHYDGFGRPVASVPPPVAGCPDGTGRLPSATIAYELTTDPAAQPLSRVRTTTWIREKQGDVECAEAAPIVGMAYVDGLGRPRAAISTGDDGHAWVRSGITTFDAKGSVRRSYQPDFYDGSEADFRTVIALPSTIPYAVTRYDGFGRARGVIAEDGSTVWTSHHALSTDVCDPLDNDLASPHYRTCTTARVDGHGRVIDQVLRNRNPDSGASEHHRLWSWYRQDGAVLALARTLRDAPETRPDAVPVASPTTVVRTFTYDSVGRRWTSADPDTDSRAVGITADRKSWRYLFNRVGDLVAVRDPRGCGQNFIYDLGGRLLGEQYVSCAEAQSSVSETPTTTVPAGIAMGPVADQVVAVRYYYDDYSDSGWSSGVRPTGDDAHAVGMPTGVEDRGQRSVISYDQRGNAVWSARQMALISNAAALVPETSPNGAPRRNETVIYGTVAYDEAPGHTYVRTATFDHAARPVSMTLPTDPDFGVDAPDVAGSLTYNMRGLPATATAHVDENDFPIITDLAYSRDGLVEQVTYGGPQTGAAATRSETRYDSRRRPTRFTTVRTPIGSPAPGTLAAVDTVVDQQLVWDAASNLTDIVDHRDGAAWASQPGVLPRTTHVDHDSLYRVVGAFFEYNQPDGSRTPQDSASDYRDTINAISTAGADPMNTRPADMLPSPAGQRAVSLTWSYDFLANTTDWTDDANSFYERSIGQITNGLDVDGRPSALYFSTNIDSPLSATDAADGNAGWLEVDYGDGGNVTAMTVRAQCGPEVGQLYCTPGASSDRVAQRDSLRTTCACAREQQYEYRWDELDRLAEARRWDRASSGPWALKVRQRYRYDFGNQRTVKQTLEPDGEGEPTFGTVNERIALYVLAGDYERRGLQRGSVTYEPSMFGTETQYFVAGARLVWRNDTSEPLPHQSRRLTQPLTDGIRTLGATLDLISGDLLEASTHYPNGARETLLVDTGDPSTAEPAAFTGKEADEEVGLVYFGQRYLIPRIGRWASPDPLHIHELGGGEVLNSFHYVSARLLQARDAQGLSWQSFGNGFFRGFMLGMAAGVTATALIAAGVVSAPVVAVVGVALIGLAIATSAPSIMRTINGTGDDADHEVVGEMLGGGFAGVAMGAGTIPRRVRVPRAAPRPPPRIRRPARPSARTGRTATDAATDYARGPYTPNAPRPGAGAAATDHVLGGQEFLGPSGTPGRPGRPLHPTVAEPQGHIESGPRGSLHRGGREVDACGEPRVLSDALYARDAAGLDSSTAEGIDIAAAQMGRPAYSRGAPMPLCANCSYIADYTGANPTTGTTPYHLGDPASAARALGSPAVPAAAAGVGAALSGAARLGDPSESSR